MKLISIHTEENKKIFINPESIMGMTIGRFRENDSRFQVQFFIPNLNMFSSYFDTFQAAENFLIESGILEDSQKSANK